MPTLAWRLAMRSSNAVAAAVSERISVIAAKW